jgi:hypothetical protein
MTLTATDHGTAADAPPFAAGCDGYARAMAEDGAEVGKRGWLL